jgi:hypothetical protein
MKTFKSFYRHDCPACKHLKSVTRDNTNYDLYFCLQHGVKPTVIARYGTDGNYLSGLSFADEGILKEAAEAAIEEGLL